MERRRTPRAMPLAVFAAVAVLPDLDFLWGRHNMETHSLGAAVLAGLAVLAWTRGKNPLARAGGHARVVDATSCLIGWGPTTRRRSA